MFIRHKQDTENSFWIDCHLTSIIHCLFKDFFGCVHCCADFVNLQVFIFAVIYDVLCQGDTSVFVKRNVG
jgi:hypothetical protein